MIGLEKYLDATSSPWVKISVLYPERDFILQIEPASEPGLIFDWSTRNREFIEVALVRFGGIAFRGFQVAPKDFLRLTDCVSTAPRLNYVAGIAPRAHLGNGLYLSTTIERHCTLPQHHEMSYFRKWPMKVFFLCQEPSETGGETPVASTRAFMAKVDGRIVERIARREVLYMRNYIEGINSTWKNSFETEDPATVLEICKMLGIQAEFRKNGALRTRNIAQGVANHPVTGELLWHNHAHVFNLFSGSPGTPTPTLRMSRAAYTPEYFEKMLQLPHEELPANTYYGDGELFESSVIEEVSQILEEEKQGFRWNRGDLLLLDNMLAFHGRNPFEGDQRKILAVFK